MMIKSRALGALAGQRWARVGDRQGEERDSTPVRRLSVPLDVAQLQDVLGVLRSAATITSIYIFLFIFAAMTISAVDGFPILKSLFEAASAIGTVGLSMGITGGLGTLSKLILTFLMYFGRVGCLTILYAIRTKSGAELSKSPLERIAVG